MSDGTHRRREGWTTIGYCARCWSEVAERDEHCDHCGTLRGDGWVDDPLRDRALNERYVLQERIGEGGMALVYRATDRRLSRDIAIKILRPELAGTVAARRFLAEARLASSLSSPHVVRVFDFGEDDDLVFIASELLVGTQLEDLLQDAPIEPELVLELLRQVGEALEEAHDAGIVHRDVKPGNIFMLEHATGPWFKLLDFGIARAMEEVAGSTRLTRTGFIVGTAPYMSPEQVMGDGDLDGRSDLFSLGLIASELLTGEPAHVGTSGREIMLERISSERPPLATLMDVSDLPDGLPELVDQLVRRDREDRVCSAGALVDLVSDDDTLAALASARRAELAATLEAPPPERARIVRPARRRDLTDRTIVHRTDALAEDAIEAGVRRPRRRRWLALAAALVAGVLGFTYANGVPEIDITDWIGGPVVTDRAPSPPLATAAMALRAHDAAASADTVAVVRRGGWNDLRVALAYVAEAEHHHLELEAERQDPRDGTWRPLTLGGATIKLLDARSHAVVAMASRNLHGQDTAAFTLDIDQPGRYHVDVALRPANGEQIRFRCDMCTSADAPDCDEPRTACVPIMASEVAHLSL